MQTAVAVVRHFHRLPLKLVALLFALQDLTGGIARQRLAEIEFQLKLVQFLVQLDGGFAQALLRLFDVGDIGFTHTCEQRAAGQ